MIYCQKHSSKGAQRIEKQKKTLALNRKARHDYFVLETLEAGIELVGTEVKSIRLGQCNLKDCYVMITGREAFIEGMHISPYERGNRYNTEPLRRRRLLLHKQEIFRLGQTVSREGMTLIPLSLYLVKGYIKVELGICKGKKTFDKRDDAAERDAKRDIDRAVKQSSRVSRGDE